MRETRQWNANRMLIGLILLVCCIWMAGCASGTDENGSKISEDGRSYGGTVEGTEGETVSTAFFKLTVDETRRQDTCSFADGLYQAVSGQTYLIVTLTIENTYEQDLSMSVTDFTLDYEGNEAEEVILGYGRSELDQPEFMEDVFTLKKGESVTGSILYMVPQKDAYQLCYREYYEDAFEGDQFVIALPQ
ncbi:MAG: DUF4352 domain-containing protein [Lachnospiraceae bacterium]|nr:DUF4352 domain-containing protein [Lachnospiraceae bacterium]